jgi:hypothetical protein
MPFIWKDYFDLAVFLQTNNLHPISDEATKRSAVSRSYYAAFCHARNYARDKFGFKPTYTERDHYDIREFYRPRRLTNVSAILNRLREWRNSSDYNDEVPNLNDMCTNATRETAKIFNILK